MEEFCTLDSSEKTIAILKDRWYPQAAKQERDKTSITFLCIIWKRGNERASDGDVSIRSRNGALSRKGSVWSMVIGLVIRQATNAYPPGPLPTTVCALLLFMA